MEIKVTKDNYIPEVMESDVPVLIDFWAAWCGPCQMVAPVLSEIAEEQDGKIKVCKINIDEEPELAAAFQVSSIPMLAVIKNGEMTKSSVGAIPKEQILELLK